MKEQTKAEILIRDIKDYLSNQYELTLMKATDKFAFFISALISQITAIVLIVMCVIFCSLSASFYLSGESNKGFGFLLVGGCYILLLIVFRLLIIRPLRIFLQNRIIFSVLKNRKL